MSSYYWCRWPDFGNTSSGGNYGANGVDTAFTIPTGPTVYTAAGGGGGGGADASNGRPGGSWCWWWWIHHLVVDLSIPTSPLNPGPAPGQGNRRNWITINGAAGGGGGLVVMDLLKWITEPIWSSSSN